MSRYDKPSRGGRSPAPSPAPFLPRDPRGPRSPGPGRSGRFDPGRGGRQVPIVRRPGHRG